LPVIGDLEQTPAVRVELRLDGVVGAALDPEFDAAVKRFRRGRGQVEVPAFALLAVGILQLLLADYFRGEVTREIDGEHIADGGLPDQALLRRQPHARFRRRTEYPRFR